ncbi:MAG: NYN domain-containing protein [Rhizobacter sp.]|nr:NYN domain-containing protein [Burkholderiaceae bacterium]MCO5122370.1 NYN domain-containing protein [Rhizobacter sp.]
MNSDPRVMVLIDADNVSANVLEQALIAVVERHGAAHVRRAYCTAESAVKHLALFKRLSVRPIVNVSTGKNSTDIALAVDAIDLAIAERPDVVVVVSSDSDFAPLVIRLREKGCRVEGIGQKGKTGEESTQVYDAFVDLEHRAKARSASTSAAPRAAAPGSAALKPAPKAATKRAGKSDRRTTPKPAEKPAKTAPPPDVQEILAAVPALRGGAWVELRTAAEPLRKAKLLGKTAASTKVFKKHVDFFELQPDKQPNRVRYTGPA